MPRPKKTDNETATMAEGDVGDIAPYFREVFKANRRFLKARSNKLVLKMWLRDHPGFETVPKNVKAGMAIVKSEMRAKMRTRQTKEDIQSDDAPSDVDSGLEKLEMMIDDCMNWARTLDMKLTNVIETLIVARRQVVWKLGQEKKF